MRFLHTSDLHIGKRLNKFSLEDVHSEMFDFLVRECDDKKIDIVLIVGDVFNVPNPDFKSEKLFYDGLSNLTKNRNRLVIISAGNHDSAKKIDVTNSLAIDNGIIFIPTISTFVNNGEVYKNDFFEIYDIKAGCFKVKFKGEDIAFMNFGYPSEENVNYYRENYEEVKNAENYKDRIKEIAKINNSYYTKDMTNIVLGHMYVSGDCEKTDSEIDFNIGGLYEVGVDLFSKDATYIALGHLHRKQAVKGVDNAFYSGSPFGFSKSEAGQKKYAITFECENGIIIQDTLSSVEFTLSKKVIKKTFKDMDSFKFFAKSNEHENAYVFVTLDGDDFHRFENLNHEIESIISEIDFFVDIDFKAKVNETIDSKEYKNEIDIYTEFKELATMEYSDIDEESLRELFALYNSLLEGGVYK
ncbi:MAG: exonuclease SbcCD subunit D [Lachnospirales bacterium]